MFGVSEMYDFKNQLTPEQESRLQALDAWHPALGSRELCLDRPDAYHDELSRLSDEMARPAKGCRRSLSACGRW
jgi:hypothetical protein